jgi:PAS domain S-box-containing protein
MNHSLSQSLIDHFQHSQHFYFILTDTNGRIIHANPLFSTDTGFNQHLSLDVQNFIAGKDIKRYHAAMKECSRKTNNNTITTDLLCLHPDGSSFRIMWELFLRQSENREPDYIQWVGIKRQRETQRSIPDPKKADEKLQQSELFYRNLIADSLDGMVLTDNTGIISFSSASVKKILGYEPEELEGKNIFDFMHPDDRPRGWTAFVNQVGDTPVAKFINARVSKKTGEWLWCMIRGHNMFDNPHVGAMLVYFCDDTLRMNAEMTLIEGDKRFRQLINNLSLGVILLNGKGEMLICNQACFDIFNISGDSLTGTNLFSHSWNVTYENGDSMPVAEYPVTVAMRLKKNVKDAVLCVGRNDLSYTWLLVNAEPVLDEQEQVRYIICSFQDITEQKRLSGQLIEQEIQRQKQLVQATIDAQEKERKEIGRELHDNISQHITTTRLYLEVAMEKAGGEVLSLITQAHKGLQDTVNEMRQLSQSLVPPSLSDIGLVESVEDLCSPLKNTHAFRIEFFHHDFNETILPDNMKLMLFRIIQEQINNIIRHAHATAIHIGLETIEGSVILSVSDNGKGFDPVKVKRGLGLSNMGNRADLFGGTLKIDTTPGKGCSIRVLIPLSR